MTQIDKQLLAAVQQQDSGGYYLVVDLPDTDHIDNVGPATVKNDALPCELIKTLAKLQLTGVVWYEHPIVSGTDRRIYAVQTHPDLMDDRHPLSTLLAHVEELLKTAHAYAADKNDDLSVLIKARADRALLDRLADIHDAGGVVSISLGTSGKTVLNLVGSGGLASIKAQQTLDLTDEPVVGVVLGGGGTHTVHFANGKTARVTIDQDDARAIIAKPHRFTGQLVNSGSAYVIDTSSGKFAPSPNLGSPRQLKFGHTPSP